VADKDRKDKSFLLDIKTALNETLIKRDQETVKMSKSINSNLDANQKILLDINAELDQINRNAQLTNKLLHQESKAHGQGQITKKDLLEASTKKDYARKKDPNLKVIQELNDLEMLMKENNKLQKEKKKGSGLLGLLGLAGGLLGIGGLLGFIFTGKKEFLFSVVKGFVKGFESLFAPVGKLLGSIGKMLGLDKLVGGLGKSLGKLIGGMFKPAGELMGTIAKAIGFGGLKTGGKAGGKVLGKIGKQLFKKIPGIGLIMGVIFGIQRFKSGDIFGGLGEIASGIASTFPVVGTAISLAIDSVLLLRDTVGPGNFAEGAGKAVGAVGKMGWEAMKSIAGFGPIAWMLEGIQKFASDPIGALESIASGIMGIVPKTGEFISNIIGWIKSVDIGGTAKKAWEGVKSVVTNPGEAIKNAGKGVLGGIKNMPFVKGMAKGFTGAGKAAKSAAESATDYAYQNVIGPSNLKNEPMGTVTGIGIDDSQGGFLPSEMKKKSVNGEGWKVYEPWNPDIKDINPMLWNPFNAMAKEYKDTTGKEIQINSGYRNQKGSLHGAGLAIDIQPKDANELEKAGLLKKYGLHRPLLNWKVKKEPWHVELYPGSEYGKRDTNNYQFRKSVISNPGNAKGDGGYDISTNKLKDKFKAEDISTVELSDTTIEKLAYKITEGYKNSMPKRVGATISAQPIGRG
jgi:hypothetical protein